MKKGFTLIEMLVVIGIIAVLTGALVAGYGHVTKTAQDAKAREAVHNVAAALENLLVKNGRWPTDLGALRQYGGRDGADAGCVVDVARVFAKHKAMSVATKGNTDAYGFTLVGQDRCGIVSPWAQAVLKRTTGEQGAGATLPVPSGGVVRDHVIYYAIDTDHDGITVATVCGEQVRVRAKAIAWCAGADGKLGTGYRRRNAENADNVYSWARAQEERSR